MFDSETVYRGRREMSLHDRTLLSDPHKHITLGPLTHSPNKRIGLDEVPPTGQQLYCPEEINTNMYYKKNRHFGQNSDQT